MSFNVATEAAASKPKALTGNLVVDNNIKPTTLRGVKGPNPLQE
jgi:hypothetical protein